MGQDCSQLTDSASGTESDSEGGSSDSAEADFPFRAISRAKLTKENLRGPLKYFYKANSDEPGDATTEWVRTLKGKAIDYSLSETPPAGSKVAFYSHTRYDLEHRIDEKINHIIQSMDTEYKDCTHIWIDAACFDQVKITEDTDISVSFDDLLHVIQRCDDIIPEDQHSSYWGSAWCLVEMHLWKHYKKHGPERFTNKKGLSDYVADQAKKAKGANRSSPKQIKQIQNIIHDASKIPELEEEMKKLMRDLVESSGTDEFVTFDVGKGKRIGYMHLEWEGVPSVQTEEYTSPLLLNTMSGIKKLCGSGTS